MEMKKEEIRDRMMKKNNKKVNGHLCVTKVRGRELVCKKCKRMGSD